MQHCKNILARFRDWFSGAGIESDVEAELHFHLEMQTEANLARGLRSEAARDAALSRFGDYERIRQECYEIGRRNRPVMKALKPLTIALVLAGLTLRAAGTIVNVQRAGDVLMMIGILWCLLLYLRGQMQSALQLKRRAASTVGPHFGVGASPLKLSENRPAAVPFYDEQGRTPVERVMSNDE